MAELSRALADIHAKEIEANENALAQCFPGPPGLSSEAQQLLVPFVQWTEMQRVRALPARPTSVAAFVQWQRDLGVSKEKINAVLSAIEAMHFAASLANPCATPLVRITTAASTIEAPRSWTGPERQMFKELPVEAQAVIARREADRERTMRRAQNEAGELRNLLKRQQADAAPKSADTTKGNEMPTKEGPYSKSGGDDVKMTRKPDKGWTPGRQIDVDETVNDGFAAPLRKKPE